VIKKIIIVLILLAGFGVRLYRINAPLADWHSWRQADTAAVARNFIKRGYTLLKPRFDDLSHLPSGKENPEGYRFVEFPIYNLVHALFFQAVSQIKDGWLSFEAAGRLVSIFSSLGAALFLYLIVKEVLGEALAVSAMFFFLFLPYNIYYSRTILPESTMIMFSLASIYLLIKRKPVLSSILASLAILVKPFSLFLIAPSLAVVFGRDLIDREKRQPARNRVLIYSIISLTPFFLWRLWMRRFPEGVPGSNWLFNVGDIRLRPAWWRWLFEERLAKLILGSWGLIPFGLGLIAKAGRKKEALFFSWLGGILAYLVIFAGGNVRHDYYQVIAIPAIAVFLARGLLFLLKPPKRSFSPFFSFILGVTAVLFMFGFSWYQVKEYYKINHPEIIAAGRAADRLLPPEAKVIAPYNGDTAFLYQTNRQGWPMMTYHLEKMVQLGATHYLSVNFDENTNFLINRCGVLEKNDQWVIIDLADCF